MTDLTMSLQMRLAHRPARLKVWLDIVDTRLALTVVSDDQTYVFDLAEAQAALIR